MNKKLLKLLLLLIILIPLNVYANTVINGNNFTIYNRTKEAIYNKWRVGRIDPSINIYTTEPSYVAPYRAGVVTTDYLDEVLDNLNYYRYLVGVPEITVRTSNDEALQKAEVIQTLYVEENLSLTHTLYEDFEKPDDMSDDFWGSEEECKNEGICYGAYANHNIISYGRPDEPNFYFFDESIFDEYYPQAGHRMALLSPDVAKEDYGIGEEVIYGRSTLDEDNYTKMTNSFAAYPSPGYFPKEDFADTSDWDIFLNINNFKNLTVAEQNNVVVTIRNLTTDEVETRTVADENLVFDNYCYGSPCTHYNNMMNILQPTKDGEYYEDSYEVYVANLKDKSGNLVDIKYTVNFYNKLEGTTSNITGVNQELKGVYYDGEFDQELIESVFEDLSYGLELDAGDSYEYIPSSHTIEYSGAPSSGIVEYHAFPSTSDLPSYIHDDNHILANKYTSVYGNTTNATYKYTYANLIYNADVGDNITIRVNNLTTGLEGYYMGGWVRKQDNMELTMLNDEKYSFEDDNILALNINNITADDAGEYYQITLLLAPDDEGNFEVYFYLSKPITLTVNTPVESISIDSESMTINVGDTEKLNVTVTPNTANPNLTWQSSDSTIVSVDNEGNITGLKAGTATVTVTSGNLSDTITITVTSYLKGDLNKNNRIDLPDIIYLLKKYLSIETTTQEDITIGDMNEDGNLGLMDIILLLRIYLGVN